MCVSSNSVRFIFYGLHICSENHHEKTKNFARQPDGCKHTRARNPTPKKIIIVSKFNLISFSSFMYCVKELFYIEESFQSFTKAGFLLFFVKQSIIKSLSIVILAWRFRPMFLKCYTVIRQWKTMLIFPVIFWCCVGLKQNYWHSELIIIAIIVIIFLETLMLFELLWFG